jgi:hypothetical protein
VCASVKPWQRAPTNGHRVTPRIEVCVPCTVCRCTLVRENGPLASRWQTVATVLPDYRYRVRHLLIWQREHTDGMKARDKLARHCCLCAPSALRVRFPPAWATGQGLGATRFLGRVARSRIRADPCCHIGVLASISEPPTRPVLLSAHRPRVGMLSARSMDTAIVVRVTFCPVVWAFSLIPNPTRSHGGAL